MFLLTLYIRVQFVISYHTIIKHSDNLFYAFSEKGGGGDEFSLRFIIFLLRGLFGVFQ